MGVSYAIFFAGAMWAMLMIGFKTQSIKLVISGVVGLSLAAGAPSILNLHFWKFWGVALIIATLVFALNNLLDRLLESRSKNQPAVSER